MIPFSGDYNPIISPYGTYAYTPPLLLLNPYMPWLSHLNCIQSVNNLAFNTSVSSNAPSTLNTPEQMEDCNPYFPQKQHSKMKNRRKSNNKLIGTQQDSHYFRNKIQNEQSSYNNRRKRVSIHAKKSKQGPQNKNRNILPSIVQQILSFLTKQTKSKTICQKIFAVIPHPESVQVSIPRYYYYIKQIKEKQNHYVNEQTLKILFVPQDIGIDLFPEAQQRFYLKTARILARHFLVNVSPFLTLYSKRIIRDKRIEHLSTRKVLLHMISQLSC